MALKRRRQQKTDYRQRLAMLRSGLPRVAVRRTLNNIRVQFIEFDETGDKVKSEFLSKSLKKFGWHGHCGSIPAAYLAGLAAGKEAQKKGIKTAVSDIGLHNSIKGSSLFAAVLGVRDSGVNVPLGKEILPSMDRISGKHIAAYADLLKKKDQDRYKKQFSSYLKQNIAPENLHTYFEETKQKIMSGEVKE